MRLERRRMTRKNLHTCGLSCLIFSLLGLLCCVPRARVAEIADKGAKQPASPLSIRIIPKQATLWGGRASQRFVVLGTFPDGLERDVTSQSRFSISDLRLASIDPAGRLVPLADGELDVKVQVGKQSATSHVRIEGSKESPPFSFARDIGRILTQRGCNAVDCHGSVKGQKGFKLSLNALYPREDYAWIVDGGIYQVLTTEQPKPRVP